MAEELRKLFVARLPWTACRVALRDYFGKFGTIERTQVLFDQNTGRSRRFGFVVFKDEEGMKNAIKCNQHEIHDTEIFVQPHNPARTRNEKPVQKDPLDIVIGE